MIDGASAGPYEVRVQPFTVTLGGTYDGRAAPVRAADSAPIGEEQDCLEAVPAAASPPYLTGPPQLDLAVRVLVDGPALARAVEIFGTATESYAPLGVTLRAVSFETVRFSGDDARGLIDQGKAHYGGTRPAGADLVYVFTSEEIQAGGNTAVAVSPTASAASDSTTMPSRSARTSDLPSRTTRCSAAEQPRCWPTSWGT